MWSFVGKMPTICDYEDDDGNIVVIHTDGTKEIINPDGSRINRKLTNTEIEELEEYLKEEEEKCKRCMKNFKKQEIHERHMKDITEKQKITEPKVESLNI